MGRKKKFKVIIAGGRDFDQWPLLKKKCDRVLDKKRKEFDIEIVSGKAKGADSLGEKYAELKGYRVKEFPADWDTHGKKAGPIRNGQMADYADALIAFHDGVSRGTANMIKQAKEKGLAVRVIAYDPYPYEFIEEGDPGTKQYQFQVYRKTDGSRSVWFSGKSAPTYMQKLKADQDALNNMAFYEVGNRSQKIR